MGHLSHERSQRRRRLVERLWAEGKTAREIAEVVGWKTKNPNAVIVVLRRQRGYNLPHRRTPEQLGRIMAGYEERIRKARAAIGRT